MIAHSPIDQASLRPFVGDEYEVLPVKIRFPEEHWLSGRETDSTIKLSELRNGLRKDGCAATAHGWAHVIGITGPIKKERVVIHNTTFNG